MQTIERFAVPAGVAETKTRSPQITGDECPEPGSSIFQLKSASENCAGNFGALAMPEP